jgi:hypothetical protein
MNSGVLPRRQVQRFGAALQAAPRPLIRNDQAVPPAGAQSTRAGCHSRGFCLV